MQESPEQREKRLAGKARYRARNKDAIRAASLRYRQQYAAEIRERKRLAYLADTEKVKRRVRAWKQAHKKGPRVLVPADVRRARKRATNNAWRKANKQTVAERKRRDYWADVEKSRSNARERTKRYWRENPQLILARIARRRARKLNATIGDPKAIIQWEQRWKRRYSVICFWCREPFPPKKCHSDHIIPLHKGGGHSVENLCVACGTCNQKKQDAMPTEWNQRLSQPVLL